jgi:hypothetical protein
MSHAEIKMPLSEYDAMRRKVEKLESELRDAHSQYAEARLGDADSEVRRYRDAFEAAMRVARFGIGNLNPLTVRGWPYQALFTLAEHLDKLPGLSAFEREGAGEIRLFANECKRWEDARAQGREQELLAGENAARGPVTPPEAA